MGHHARCLDLGSYHWVVNSNSTVIGGDENKLLRQAISQAINRDELNEAVYNGSRTPSTGVTPPGIPGYKEGLCLYCEFDEAAAQAAFDEWTAAGNSLSEPIPLQFNADAGHEPVAQIMIDNLAARYRGGCRADASETYVSQLADGACKAISVPGGSRIPGTTIHVDGSRRPIGGNNIARSSTQSSTRWSPRGSRTGDKTHRTASSSRPSRYGREVGSSRELVPGRYVSTKRVATSATNVGLFCGADFANAISAIRQNGWGSLDSPHRCKGELRTTTHPPFGADHPAVSLRCRSVLLFFILRRPARLMRRRRPQPDPLNRAINERYGSRPDTVQFVN